MAREIDFVKTFPAEYEIEVLGSSVVVFPLCPGDDKLRLVIHCLKPSNWVGIFRAGIYEKSNGIYSCPNPQEICVLCAGAVSIVNIHRALTHGETRLDLIRDVIPVQKYELLIFVRDTHLLAYGKEGTLWKSKSLCSDELQIVRTEDRYLHAKGYFAPRNETKDFRVDVVTGEQVDWVYHEAE